MGFDFYEAAAYGALISAIDPVSIISVLKRINIDKGLFATIFGESIFNTVISIVLYQIVIQAFNSTDQTSTKFFTSIASFVLALLGALTIGVSGGLATALLLKRNKTYTNETELQKKHNKLNGSEVGTMIISPVVVYLISQVLRLSGIATILFTGLVLSQYAAENLSLQTRKILKLIYQVISYIGENTVFIFLGMTTVNHLEIFYKTGYIMIIVNIMIILFARGCGVLLCSILRKMKRGWGEIINKEKLVMWCSALKGTVTYGLAMRLYTDLNNTKNKDYIMALTISFSLFTLFAQSVLLHYLLLWNFHESMQNNAANSENKEGGFFENLKSGFAYFDEFYLSKYFLPEKMPNQAEPLLKSRENEKNIPKELK